MKVVLIVLILLIILENDKHDRSHSHEQMIRVSQRGKVFLFVSTCAWILACFPRTAVDCDHIQCVFVALEIKDYEG